MLFSVIWSDHASWMILGMMDEWNLKLWSGEGAECQQLSREASYRAGETAKGDFWLRVGGGIRRQTIIQKLAKRFKEC